MAGLRREVWVQGANGNVGGGREVLLAWGVHRSPGLRTRLLTMRLHVPHALVQERSQSCMHGTLSRADLTTCSHSPIVSEREVATHSVACM